MLCKWFWTIFSLGAPDKNCHTEILAGGCIVFPNPTCTKRELDITPIIVKKSYYIHINVEACL